LHDPRTTPCCENAAIQKQAAQEITRICSLPEADREVALKKLKEESGVVLYCAAN